MSTKTVPPGDSFEIINLTSIRYNGRLYKGVSKVTYTDDTTKTPAEILTEAGGVFFSESEVKKCVKVEGYDESSNNRQVFSLYSGNSRQVSKNETASVPGRMWCEMFDFKGTADNNPVLFMWKRFFDAISTPSNTIDYTTQYNDLWLGFKINYGIMETRAYIFTQINDLDEESSPSPPVTCDVTYMDFVRLSGIFKPRPPLGSINGVGGHHYLPVKRFRLYRSITSSDGSFNWRWVPGDPFSMVVQSEFPVEDPIASSFGIFPESVYKAYPGNYTARHGWMIEDRVRNEDLTETTLIALDWDFPPVQEIRGLAEGWNGMMFGHWGNTIIPFEPYRPHTAPIKYRLSLPYPINATVRVGNSLLALTSGPAYLITGAHPSQLQYEAVANTRASIAAATQPGGQISTRSVVVTPVGLCYACDEGICLNGVNMLTDRLYDKIAWQTAFNSSKLGRLHLAYSNEKVLAIVANDATINHTMISTEGGWLSQLSNINMRSSFSLPGSDGLYMVLGTNPSTLVKCELALAGRSTFVWTSKKMVFPFPTIFGCFQIAGLGIIQLTIYVDNQQWFFQQVALNEAERVIRRLPTGKRGTEWQVTLRSTVPNAMVREFYMAGTPVELRAI